MIAMLLPSSVMLSVFMAEIANTIWYRTGSVAVTQKSANITGTDTRWTSAVINPGAMFRLYGSYMDYEVLKVVDWRLLMIHILH